MRHKKHGNTLCVAVLFAYPKNRRKAFAPVKLGGKSSKCNTFFEENFGGRAPTETFSGAVVDQSNDLVYGLLRDLKKITALREKEPQQIVRVFVRASLPRLVRFGKIYRRLELRLQRPKLRKLGAVVQADAPHRQPFQKPTDHGGEA